MFMILATMSQNIGKGNTVMLTDWWGHVPVVHKQTYMLAALQALPRLHGFPHWGTRVEHMTGVETRPRLSLKTRTCSFSNRKHKESTYIW